MEKNSDDLTKEENSSKTDQSVTSEKCNESSKKNRTNPASRKLVSNKGAGTNADGNSPKTAEIAEQQTHSPDSSSGYEVQIDTHNLTATVKSLQEQLRNKDKLIRSYEEKCKTFSTLGEVCHELKEEVNILKRRTSSTSSSEKFSSNPPEPLIQSEISHIDDSVINSGMDQELIVEGYDDFQISHESFSRPKSDISSDKDVNSEESPAEAELISYTEHSSQLRNVETVDVHPSGSLEDYQERPTLQMENLPKPEHSHVPLQLLMNEGVATKEIEDFCQNLYTKYGLDERNLEEMGQLIQKYFYSLVKTNEMEKHMRTKITLIYSLTEENQQLKTLVDELRAQLKDMKSQLHATLNENTFKGEGKGAPSLSESSLSLTNSTSSWAKVGDSPQKVPLTKTMGQLAENVLQKSREQTKEEVRLQMQVQDLAKANVDWEAHCQKLSEQNEQRVTELIQYSEHLKSELSSVKTKHKQHLREVAQNTERKIREASQGQLQLEQAVQDTERQAEQLREELERKDNLVSQLTARVDQLEHNQKQSRHLDMEEAPYQTERVEMDLLRQQVSQYKEDFEKEHSEHNRTKKERDYLRSQIYRFETENQKTYSQLQVKDNELQQMKREYITLKTSHKLKTSELEKEREAHRVTKSKYNEASKLLTELEKFKSDRLMEQQQQPPVAGTAHPQPSRPYTPIRLRQKWSCLACTFENIAERMICEMCGSRAPYEPNVGNTTQVPSIVRNSSSSSIESDRQQRLHALMSRGADDRPADQCDSVPRFNFSNLPGDLEEDKK